jgi:thiamine kinase-like enzyme
MTERTEHMTGVVPLDVLEAFSSYEKGLPIEAVGKITVEPLSGGLINHSYRVSCPNKPDFFLQQINADVFPSPQTLQQNYIHLWEYSEFEFTGFHLPDPRYFNRTKSLYHDQDNQYWRAFEFIGNASTASIAQKPAQAKAVAKAFARFTSVFQEFNVELLEETIPGFHDLGLRYRQFEHSLSKENYERIAEAQPLIYELKKREKYIHFFEIILESGEFLKRVTHHDAKIANILFNRATGRVICPVDYDTAMPGYFFSDLGDMIRSMAASHNEDYTQFRDLYIRKAYYNAIIEGYLQGLGKQLTHAEKKYVHSAGLLIIYMQALRFLTDFLMGDIYYRTEYPGHNFDRARNQYFLLERLEEFLKTEFSFSI